MLLVHEFLQIFPAGGMEKKMTRQYALRIDARVFYTGDQIMPELVGIVTHPRPLQFGGLQSEALPHERPCLEPRYSSNQSAKVFTSAPMSGQPWTFPSFTMS